MSEKQFAYEVDWFNSFEKYLKNLENVPEKTHFNIKCNIIEVNQSLEDLIKRWNMVFAKKGYQLNLFPSEEIHFKNLELKTSKGSYFFYIREEEAENPRFWVVYNTERQKDILPYIKSIFQQFYRQDCVYFSNSMMVNYTKEEDISPSGFSLSFKQAFYDDIPIQLESDYEEDSSPEIIEELEPETENEIDSEPEFEDNYDSGSPLETKLKNPLMGKKRQNHTKIIQNSDDMKNIGYSMRLWAGTPNTYNNIFTKINASGLPINFKSLMCFFSDEDLNQILKEEFNFIGGFTINSGTDFERHVKFVQSILQDYKEKMSIIESYRMNLKEGKGKLIKLDFNESINRELFIDRINQNQKEFRLFFTRLFAEDNYSYYRVADLHNGDHFYAQVYDDCVFLNLHKECCGNNVFRLFTNLQKYFSPSIFLEIDGNKMNI